MAIPAFTRPEESVFEDAEGGWFVLKKGSKAYEELKLQYFNDEETDGSKTIQDITHMAMLGQTREQIEQNYGKVQPVVGFEEAVKAKEGLSPGLVLDKNDIGNVFDEHNKVHSSPSTNGFEALRAIGVPEAKVNQLREKKTLIGKL